MVIVMNSGADRQQIDAVMTRLDKHGFDVHKSSGIDRTVLGAIGVQHDFDLRHLRLMPGVSDVFRVTEPYKFASRSWKKESTKIKLPGLEIGGDSACIISGPSSVESEEQIQSCAAELAKNGCKILRGGCFKPRTSPYSFQGLGEEGLKMLKSAAESNGLLTISEVMEPGQVSVVASYVDILQVGARNMQNYSLLKVLGETKKPVLLKRGMSATIEEWLMSAEYLMANGNMDVILCERGIRTYETYTRNTLDLTAVPVIHKKSHLPVFVDPSHGTGIRDKVLPMSRAAIAAGADGLMIEIHPDPSSALSDGPQSLYFEQFGELLKQIRDIAKVLDREIV